jgi:hypothetical protein
MSSAEMRATEVGPTTAEVGTAKMASAAPEVATATKVSAAAATDMTATAAAMAATAAATAAAMAAASTASLRRGGGADQNDRQNNSQDIEFRHGTLEARGLRRKGLDARAG